MSIDLHKLQQGSRKLFLYLNFYAERENERRNNSVSKSALSRLPDRPACSVLCRKRNERVQKNAGEEKLVQF